MSVKRRDSKNRVLRNGESQRKDGRYAYTYVDANGKQKFLYSWKLEKTDKLPQGKRGCVALREKIKQLQKDLADGIADSSFTVLQLVEKYIRQKTGVREGTKKNYRYVLGILGDDPFGSGCISDVKQSDAKEWFIYLHGKGLSYGTVGNIRGIIRPAFQMAVDDDLIRKNPFAFSLAAIIANDSGKREAITEEQEKNFLEFIKNDGCYSKYYDEIYILFNTGLRISEFVGLAESNIDFAGGRVKVDHQLLIRTIDGHSRMIIENPKSENGVRDIPMSSEVAECFKRIIEKRKPSNGIEIDGIKDFLFITKLGEPSHATIWHKRFRNICNKYNKSHEVPIPKITPHICRHTFCSKMARRGMNPKMLQYVMGHSDISMTMNVYTHVTYDDIKDEMARICGK